MTISTWKLLREKWKLISSTKYFAKLSKVIGLWFIKRKTEFENIWIFAPKPTIDLVWDLVTFDAKIQPETIWLLAPKSTINTTWNSLAPKFKFETFEFWRQNTWKAGWKRSSFWNTYGSISLCKHEFFWRGFRDRDWENLPSVPNLCPTFPAMKGISTKYYYNTQSA